jgi:hypothetical protein
MIGLSPEEFRDLTLSVGRGFAKNRPLSPLEVAKLFKKSIDAGATPQEAATGVRLKGTTMVSRFMKLLRLEPDIQYSVDWGANRAGIAFSAAVEIGRLADFLDQRTLHDAALEFTLAKEELQQIIQMKDRAQSKSLDECVAAILELRPQIERRFIFVGSVTDIAIRRILANMSQVARDAILLESVRTKYPRIGDFDCRMAVERFTLAGDASLSKTLQADSDDFESIINQELSKRLLPE